MINKLYHFDEKEQFERMDDLSYNKTINYNGKNVKFVNCVAEVEDDFGKEVLKFEYTENVRCCCSSVI